MKEIVDKLDNLTNLIREKDIIINELVDKIKMIEEVTYQKRRNNCG